MTSIEKWLLATKSESLGCVVPSTMRGEVLYQLHYSALSGGHFAVEKSMANIELRFGWTSNVDTYIAKCTRCAGR